MSGVKWIMGKPGLGDVWGVVVIRKAWVGEMSGCVGEGVSG